jgi:hypothetical protein
MEKLAGELRAAYDNAPKGGKLAAVQLFAIRNAAALAEIRSSDMNALAVSAGIGMLYGGEMRLAVHIAHLVQLDFIQGGARTDRSPRKGAKSNNTTNLSGLVSELQALFDNTPEGERTAALCAFGIRHAEKLGSGNLSRLIAESGVHNSVYFTIRKGRKLADHVLILVK